MKVPLINSNNFLSTFFLLFVLLTASFSLNVVVHELGHYLIADELSLNPNMSFLNPAQDGITGFFSLKSQPIASVEFTPTQDMWKVFSVTIAGILANAILGLVFTWIFLQLPPSNVYKTLYLALVIPCVFSILLNINVFNASTDGAVLLQLFIQGA